MEKRTLNVNYPDSRMAAMESLMAGCVVGVGYGLFAGQPLTIMGSTGPILVPMLLNIFDLSLMLLINKLGRLSMAIV